MNQPHDLNFFNLVPYIDLATLAIIWCIAALEIGGAMLRSGREFLNYWVRRLSR